MCWLILSRQIMTLFWLRRDLRPSASSNCADFISGLSSCKMLPFGRGMCMVDVKCKATRQVMLAQPLRTGVIQVHAMALDGGTCMDLAPALASLSAEERVRAAGWLRPADRYRFVLARATLRRCLGAFLGVAPEWLILRKGPRGKPALGGAWSGHPLQFNVSHSGSWVLLAFALGSAVGIDIEQLKTGLDVMPLARRFFAPDEQAYLACLRGEAQRGGFYRLWAMKEARVKARGGSIHGVLSDSIKAIDSHGLMRKSLQGDDGCGAWLSGFAGHQAAWWWGGSEPPAIRIVRFEGQMP